MDNLKIDYLTTIGLSRFSLEGDWALIRGEDLTITK